MNFDHVSDRALLIALITGTLLIGYSSTAALEEKNPDTRLDVLTDDKQRMLLEPSKNFSVPSNSSKKEDRKSADPVTDQTSPKISTPEKSERK